METLAGQDTPTIAQPKRVLELDGLRAFAILPVILNHCCPINGSYGLLGFLGSIGWLGVDLFFVLSGYLITGILVDTASRPNYYGNFIIRRTLRIFPLYYVCLGLFTIGAYWSGGQQWVSLREWGVGWFAAYLGNFRGAWLNSVPPVFSFSPLWSLQVEEQYYLIFPFVVLLLSRTNLRRFLVGCIVVAPMLRLLLTLLAPQNQMAYWVLMPCRMDALAGGGLVAVLARSASGWSPSRASVRLGAVALSAAMLACYGYRWLTDPLGAGFHPTQQVLIYSLNVAAFAFLLSMVVFRQSPMLLALLRWRPQVYTGEIAYGLYLLHAPASWVARRMIKLAFHIEIPGHSLPSIPVTYFAAFIAATISWRVFETPILALKDRWAPALRR
jgi:peptidoglycan/LPS O-acetylase OafA/YrhL